MLQNPNNFNLEAIDSIAVGYYKESELITDIASSTIELVEGHLVGYWEDLDRDEQLATNVLSELYHLSKQDYNDLEKQLAIVIHDWLRYYVPDALTGDIWIDTIIHKED